MADSLAKKFESKFQKDFLKLGDCCADRLYDTTNGFHTTNICDFICYKYPNIFYVEVKTIKGNTFPFKNLTQYEKLKEKVGIKGVRSGVVIWFYDHNRIIYFPTSTITKMMDDENKSINIRYIDNQDYKFYEIPSVKKRTYFDSNYEILTTLKDGE